MLVLAAAMFVAAQTTETKTKRPSRVVVTESIPPVKVITAPTPSVKTPVVQNEDEEADEADPNGPNAAKAPQQQPVRFVPTNFRSLSFGEIKSKIAEAKRDMMSRPMQTASVDPAAALSYVRIAYYDWTNHRVDYVVMDGGSTDNTLEILRDYERRYPGRFTWVSEKDAGQCDAVTLTVEVLRPVLAAKRRVSDRERICEPIRARTLCSAAR